MSGVRVFWQSNGQVLPPTDMPWATHWEVEQCGALRVVGPEYVALFAAGLWSAAWSLPTPDDVREP